MKAAKRSAFGLRKKIPNTMTLFGTVASIMVIVSGCASQQAAENSVTEAAAPAEAEVTQASAEQQAKADAMMASLRPKDEFEVITEESTDESTNESSEAASVSESSESVAEPTPEVQAEPAPEVKAAGVEPATVAQPTPAAEPAPAAESKTQATEQTAAVAAAASVPSAQKEQTVAASQPAPVVATPKPSKKLVQKALDVSRSDLPITIEQWTLTESPVAGEGLILRTPTVQMGEGDYLSQTWLILRESGLSINSSSDIDISLNGTGVKLNGSELIPFDRLDGTSVALLEGDWMNRLADGGSMEIMLGFFPDKAQKSPIFQSETSMDALSRLVPTYFNLK